MKWLIEQCNGELLEVTGLWDKFDRVTDELGLAAKIEIKLGPEHFAEAELLGRSVHRIQ